MAENSFSMDIESVKRQLSKDGYCIIPNVISPSECDDLIGQYKTWLDTFKDGDFPKNKKSVIHQYRIGHFGATWAARLKAKPVFEGIWDTEKLLTSFDGIAIAPPSEIDDAPFDDGSVWFHCDQRAKRRGLHGYQGALYLEESTSDDYCFRVLTNSFKYHEEFFKHFTKTARRSIRQEYTELTKSQLDWYRKRNCEERKVPVPKGGMVHWDSRTIHDNVPPVRGRKHTARWRWIVFICMTPAVWADERSRERRARAYNEILMTNHWPSQNFIFFTDKQPLHEGQPMYAVDTLPEIAKGDAARRLAAVDDYELKDSQSNGPGWDPVWIRK